jgi:hypothetical protein
VKIVNSIPSFIEEVFFRQATLKTMDLIQCISRSLHPDVFTHSNVLVVHLQGSPKQVVLKEFSCSVSSSILGIPLPQCPNCQEDQFLLGSTSKTQLYIWCISCGLYGPCVLPPTLLYPKIPGVMGSLLPFPLPPSLQEDLKIRWSNTSTKKRRALDRIKSNIIYSPHKIYEKASSSLLYFLLLLGLSPKSVCCSFAIFVKTPALK